jgi:hypothetical protein
VAGAGWPGPADGTDRGGRAFYNRTLEAELTRRLGVAWRDRPDGLRELDGVDDDLIDAFSTRRRAITAELTLLVAAYEDRYGVPPPSAVVSAMAQSATLTTRRHKQPCDGAALDQWEQTTREHGRTLRALPEAVVARHPADRLHRNGGVEQVHDRLERSGRSTLTIDGAGHDAGRAAELAALEALAEQHRRWARLAARAAATRRRIAMTRRRPAPPRRHS